MRFDHSALSDRGWGRGKMYVQYVGVRNSPTFRTYTFHVVDPPRASREFTVQVPSAGFAPGRLKFQDGPGICSERLLRELGLETEALPAAMVLFISDNDVRNYQMDHYPPPKHREPKEGRFSSPLQK